MGSVLRGRADRTGIVVITAAKLSVPVGGEVRLATQEPAGGDGTTANLLMLAVLPSSTVLVTLTLLMSIQCQAGMMKTAKMVEEM